MKRCEWCNLSEADKKYLLSDTKYWTLYLADEQDYIGRCIIVLKRHCGSLPELKDDEWMELILLIQKYETCIKTVFHAEHYNWSCLMNSFYKSPEPCPLYIFMSDRDTKIQLSSMAILIWIIISDITTQAAELSKCAAKRTCKPYMNC